MGYRFGGDFFELITQQPLDLDGARTFGVVVDVPTGHAVQFEALFTHQHAFVSAPEVRYGPPVRWEMGVDHWQAGGSQELTGGTIRPYLDLTLGLTRFGTQGDNEVRFSLGGGGGVKLLPSDRFGVRLGSQVFATFVDSSGGLACSPGICLIGLNADVVWQFEFTAGLILRFP